MIPKTKLCLLVLGIIALAGCGKSAPVSPESQSGAPVQVPARPLPETTPAETPPAAAPVTPAPTPDVPAPEVPVTPPPPVRVALSSHDCVDPLETALLEGRALGAFADLLTGGAFRDLTEGTTAALARQYASEYYFFQVCRYRAPLSMPASGRSAWIVGINATDTGTETPARRLGTNGGYHVGIPAYVRAGQLGDGSPIIPVSREDVQTLGGIWNEEISFSIGIVHTDGRASEPAILWASGPRKISYYDMRRNTPVTIRFADSQDEDGVVIVRFWKGQSGERYSSRSGARRPGRR